MNINETITPAQSNDFIRDQINTDLTNQNVQTIVTRFPPEPNGYLHIGHALSICLNFGIAEEYEGRCNLRFDDTNPTREEYEFIQTIQEDVIWLGFCWDSVPKFASDNFEQLYNWAEHLIINDKAYVDDLSAEEIREYRGTLTEPGKESPFRRRSAEENLNLFRQMKAGEFPEGSRVLRAKIDMASGNINLRDPVIYRILYSNHPRTHNKWCIYPTYDFAHGQSDAIEGVTHSLCTLEFSDHRPLYDWFIEALPVPHIPRQYEFAKLQISHTILSKRRLTRLVIEGHVRGWDDPRLPTLSGMRRRGLPAQALRNFIASLSISKNEGMVELAMLEHFVRENLNRTAERRMAVINPLKLIIENFPQEETIWLDAVNNPNFPEYGSHTVPFTRELWIERDDFMEHPPRKFFRLSPGKEVRLRYAFLITCTGFKKDKDGNVTELRCVYDPTSKGGNAADGRKVRGTIHWVSNSHAKTAEIRLYQPLYNRPDPGAEADFTENLNPNSITILKNCKLEPSLINLPREASIQFERLGYFYLDKDSKPKNLIYNRTIALRDTWAKTKNKG